jgi:hypothetical protein
MTSLDAHMRVTLEIRAWTGVAVVGAMGAVGAIGAANLAAGRSSHTSVVHDMALALLNVRLLSPLRRFLALLVLVCRAGRTDSPRLPHALLTFCPCRGCSWPECSCQQPELLPAVSVVAVVRRAYPRAA